MTALTTWLDEAARARGVARADARVLAAHALDCSRTQLLARDGPPGAPARARLESLLDRRAAGEPVAYLVGLREFWSRPFRVTPSVLIPRPETELLVEQALRHLAALPARGQPCRVLDLGTGSGVIAVTLALEGRGARVTATDCSAEALAVARANAAALGAASIEFRQGDWYGALTGPGAAAAGLPPAEDVLAAPVASVALAASAASAASTSTPPSRFELIVSNPPYIAAADAHLRQGDLRHEPREALTDGADGLRAIEAIAAGAPTHLAAGGLLLVEHGWDQAGPVREILRGAGLRGPRSWMDLAGIERVSGAWLDEAAAPGSG